MVRGVGSLGSHWPGFQSAMLRRVPDVGRAGKVAAGEGFDLHVAVPFCIAEDVDHVGQAAAVEHVNVGAEEVGDAGDGGDRLERSGFRGASAAGDSRPGVGADDGDGLDLCRIERKQMAFVLEEGNALERALKRDGAVGDGVSGVGGIELRAIGEAVAKLGADEAQHLVVDGGLFYLAILHSGNEILRVHEFGAGHFEVEAVVGGGHAVIGGVPVGHEHALEAPIALENLVIEEVVLGGVNAVDQVVGVHDRINVALDDGGLEGGQIDFAHGALVHVDAGVVAIELLVVEGVVLDGGDDALGLNALNERNDDGRVEVRVFGKVFKVAAADGRAGNVDAGAEEEIDVAGAGIFAEAFAEVARKIGIPGSGQRHAAGIGGGGSPGAHADRGIGHFEAGQADDGHGMGVHGVDAADQLDFLLEGELGDHGLGLGLDCG